MTHLFRSNSTDHGIPKQPAESLFAGPVQPLGAPGKRFGRRIARMIVLAAILAVLFLLAATPRLIGPANEIAGVAASMSGATPTQAASSPAAPADNGPTGYFPDRFQVKQWDERPAPEQF